MHPTRACDGIRRGLVVTCVGRREGYQRRQLGCPVRVMRSEAQSEVVRRIHETSPSERRVPRLPRLPRHDAVLPSPFKFEVFRSHGSLRRTAR